METDSSDWKLPKTYYYPKGWVRIIDIIGMVLAPISVSLPFFILAIGFFLEASSKGTKYYEGALTLFLGALGTLIILGSYFRGALKSYFNHQATENEVNRFRRGYSILILGSLIVYFMIFYAFFFGRIS